MSNPEQDAVTHAAYEALGQRFALVEKRLKAFKVPYSVWVKMDLGSSISTWLGLHKINNEWRLCVGSEPPAGMKEPSAVQPLENSPAAIRMLAASWIPRLHDDIVKQGNELTRTIRNAIAQLDRYLEGESNG